MTDTATNPETGVEGQGDPAPDNDIDTEAFDRMEAPEDDAEPDAEADKAEGEGEGDDDPDKPDADEGGDDDTEEVEVEGQKYRVPKALKGAIMMHADYTKKTQEVAEQRRTLEQERATWESQREESRAALPEEHAKVAILNHQIASINRQLDAPLDANGTTLRKIDWVAFRQAAQGNTELAALYEDYRAKYNAARETLTDLSDQLGEAKTDLQTKEAKRLEEQRSKREAEIAKQFEETGRVLAAEVPGWNSQVASQVATFMVKELGVQAEELQEATDPRVWKLAHEAMTSRAEIARLKTALKQQQTAKDHEKAQGAKPAEKPKGGGGANARDPATPRGDGLSTSEWMRRRNAQLAAKRRP